MIDSYQRTLRWLARRDHSRWDLEQRLGDIPKEDRERLLDRLEREGYLSDRRVAESLQRRAMRKHGVQRLRRDLQQHGISEELARPILEEAAQNEFDVACQVRAARFSQWPTSLEEWGRQARYLSYRGFSTETIRRVLTLLSQSTD